MKAVQIDSYGGSEVLKFRDIKTPTPGDRQVLVRLHAIGVNFIDVYQRIGLYPIGFPATLGLEGAGEVIDVGPEVTDFQVGEGVAFTLGLGAYAECVVVAADQLVKLPGGVDYQAGASLMLQGLTAHYLTQSTYQLAAGKTCLIHAAAGGVGLLLVQIAKIMGARVIGTVSTNAKAELVKSYGADEVILYSENDFESAVKQITGGAGVDVVYDSVGQDTFEKSLNCLRHLGTMVLFGQSSGPVKPFNPSILAQKGSLFLTRPSLFDYIATRTDLESRSREVFRWYQEKKLKVTIGKTYDLKDAAIAHQDLEARRTTGKQLLIP